MDSIMQLQEFCGEIGCRCRANEPMCLHTSFKIGGSADLLAKPSDEKTAALVIAKAKALGIPVTIIGKGSNLLVSDDGVRGAVLSLDERTAPAPALLDETTVLCPAGASLAQLCAFALRHSLSGLEFAWGIPGSVGGAVYMNAGAYGGEIKDTLLYAEYLDLDGKMDKRQAEQLELGYRHSWFTDHAGCLITKAAFGLKKGESEVIRARMDELMTARKAKQPLEYPSAGSTFKRPQGAYASALIDRCGLKGRQVGGAMVSEKHAGFVINYENASCQEVLALIEEVKREVLQETGFALECEIKLLGEPFSKE